MTNDLKRPAVSRIRRIRPGCRMAATVTAASGGRVERAPRAHRRSCAPPRQPSRRSPTFLDEGSEAAVAAALARRRDRRRASCAGSAHALALAVALGDLSGELELRGGHAHSVRFCRRGDGRGAAAAMPSACPDAEPRGFAVLALGKLGSRELNYSSDVDLILLFDPETLPRRPRDEPGEAAVRYGRRLIELLQQRTARRLCRPGRPAASPVARGDADRAAGRCGDLLL